MNSDTVENAKTPSAKTIDLSEGIDLDTVFDRLGLPPSMVVVLLGGADSFGDESLRSQMFLQLRDLLPTLAALRAVVIDGGTNAGVMRVLGEAIASQNQAIVSVGVAPAKLVSDDSQLRVALEPNHSHFVLTPGDKWGDETDTIMAIAHGISQIRRSGKVVGTYPVVVIVCGGGDIVRDEIKHALQNGWPIILIGGSGGAADELVREVSSDVQRPLVADALASERISVVSLSGPPRDLQQAVLWRAKSVRHTINLRLLLEQYWYLYEYDRAAGSQQALFWTLQRWILGLTIFAALVASLSAYSVKETPPGNWIQIKDIQVTQILGILTPIVLASFAAYVSFFKPNNKWVLLRGAAEAMKREIYRYRTSTGSYLPDPTDPTKQPEVAFNLAIGAIKQSTQQTEVNVISLCEEALKGRQGMPDLHLAPGDVGLIPLSGDEYVLYRIADQIMFYKRKAIGLDKQRRFCQIGIIASGAIGSVLAAFTLTPFIAVTTASGAVLASLLHLSQTEATLVKYNQTLTDLETLESRWYGLSPASKANHANLDQLVNEAEAILERELRGWVQNMQEAFKDPTKQETAQGPHDHPSGDEEEPAAESDDEVEKHD